MKHKYLNEQFSKKIVSTKVNKFLQALIVHKTNLNTLMSGKKKYVHKARSLLSENHHQISLVKKSCIMYCLENKALSLMNF